MICGIDYGSKMAGTTVCAWPNGSSIELRQSGKKEDADAFLEALIAEIQPQAIYLDAPLSLPGVYTNNGNDYFYRACDRELACMSPLFLGGLTARAMRLANRWQQQGLSTYEAYPAGLWRQIGSQALMYKKDTKDLAACLELLQTHFELSLPAASNWHQFDALLALCVGVRHQQQQANIYGDPQEGLIYV
ncbi:MAG: DUF429 domain-containing protein [Sphingobacteriaceae bacterium]|nr:DUF429 domain-containing protein [Sphingobacteriaceae bacterium]